MDKILIFGNGFIGNHFLSYLSDTHMVNNRINVINDIYSEIEKASSFIRKRN